LVVTTADVGTIAAAVFGQASDLKRVDAAFVKAIAARDRAASEKLLVSFVVYNS
jgi:hypothetical protein